MKRDIGKVRDGRSEVGGNSRKLRRVRRWGGGVRSRPMSTCAGRYYDGGFSVGRVKHTRQWSDLDGRPRDSSWWLRPGDAG